MAKEHRFAETSTVANTFSLVDQVAVCVLGENFPLDGQAI